MEKITSLRAIMKEHGIGAYVIPSTDEWRNEYTPIHKKRLQWICGFSGSNGVLIVTESELILFTDGRYTLQAKIELDENYTIVDMYNPSGCDAMDSCKGLVVGYDPMIQTLSEIEYYEKLGKRFGYSMKSVEDNLVDVLMGNTKNISNVKTLPLEITGMSTDDKIKAITEKVPQECDFLVLTSLSSICWLLNIRGNDIPYNPMVLCYMILEIKTKKIHLFVNTSKLLNINNITIYDLNSFKDHVKGLKSSKIAFDKKNSPIWLTQNIQNGIDVEDPAVMLKAMKNPVELEGFRKAHRYDGVALCKFWFWFHKNLEKGFDEVSAAERLTEFRRENASFVEENFSTISGYGSNGAIVHYGPKKGFCKAIPSPGEDPIYLVDSGGHYDCAGTTDITRMFDLGGATDEHKTCYTAVLKGHIALANAVFPEGTAGSHLDALARYYLWQIGLDYSHGTGHGVGHFLSVHEGPQGITKRNNVPLRENMIISIEPGYYKEGHFGMRIENLYAIKKSSKFPGFLEFDLLSMVPIETSLINFSMMTQDEIAWLQSHNRVALEAVKSNLTPQELEFVSNRS
jgi:Xaa-Pro aminopeptidase